MSVRNSIIIALIIAATGLGLLLIGTYQDDKEMEELCSNPHPEMVELCNSFKK